MGRCRSAVELVRSHLGPQKRTSQTPKQKKPEDLRIFSPPLPRGSWCSGITPAQHAGGAGFNPQCVHLLCSVVRRLWQVEPLKSSIAGAPGPPAIDCRGAHSTSAH